MNHSPVNPSQSNSAEVPGKIPIVFVHGWGVNHEVWRPLIPHFPENWQVTFLDLPGYANANPCDYQHLDEVVWNLLQRAPQKAIWVGWSLGATLALRGGMLAPDRIEGLCLISPTPRFMKTVGWTCGMDVQQLEALWSVFQQSYEAGLKRFLLLQTQDRSWIRQLHHKILQHPQPAENVLKNSLQILIDADLRQQVADLKMPLHVVLGNQDQIVPPMASRLLAAQWDRCFNLPESAGLSNESDQFEPSILTELSGGHLCFLEQPELFLAALNQLVQRSIGEGEASNS